MSNSIKLVLVFFFAFAMSSNALANPLQSDKFTEFKKKQAEKYSNFKTDYLDRYEKYRTEIKEKWGVAELSSKTEYVHYSEENKTKVLTDFENDTIEVSILEADRLSDSEVDKLIRTAIVDSLGKQPSAIIKNQVEFDSIKIGNSLSVPSKSPTPTVLKQLGIASIEKLTNLLKTITPVPEKQQEAVIVKRTQQRLSKQIATLENFTSNDDVAAEQVIASKALIVSMKKEKKSVTLDANELTKKNIKTYKINLKRDRYKKAQQYLKLVEQNGLKWKLSDPFILAIM
jgi:membrane-bound lytic murein transglycosylase C